MARSRRNEPVATWESGDAVQGFLLVTRKELRQDRNGRSYLDLEVADATGSMVAKVWTDSPAMEAEFEAHQFVALRGTVKLYRDQLQLSIDECRVAGEDDRRYGFDESLLIPSTREDVADLWRRLEAALGQVRQPALERLAAHALEVHGRVLREHPAAKTIHHAYRGGLLEHVTSMAELALAVCSHYRSLDRDLVLLGVLFHDLGKIRELGAMPANDYTLEGRLVGHVVIGRDLLRESCLALGDVPDDLQLHLEHLVLSHQGRREFASPVEPMTPEALVLHFIDDLDSKLNQLERARHDGGGMQWSKGLGRYVYLAERGEVVPVVDEEDGTVAVAAPDPPPAPAEPAPDEDRPRPGQEADVPAPETALPSRGLFD
jgi:3'-5' exoribonuclease